MCNGASDRTSQGGAIAVLHPTVPSDGTLQADLLFQPSAQSPGTQATLRYRGSGGGDLLGHHVVIHHDGNLLPQQRSAPFFQFSIGPALSPQRGAASLLLNQTLDLGVGGDGVIGRRVTVYRDSGLGHVLADGIIGWN